MKLSVAAQIPDIFPGSYVNERTVVVFFFYTRIVAVIQNMHAINYFQTIRGKLKNNNDLNRTQFL